MLIWRHDWVFKCIPSELPLFFASLLPATLRWQELVIDELLVVDLHSFVHDRRMQFLTIHLLQLCVGQGGFFVSQEWDPRPPCQGGRRRSLALMSTYVEALVLFSELIEVSVWLVHARVTPLAQRSVLLVLFGGRG